MSEKIYVTHTCHNSKLDKSDPNYCFNAFVDEDKHHARNQAPTWKYCPECVAKGFVNPERKILSEGQLISLKNLKSFTEKTA